MPFPSLFRRRQIWLPTWPGWIVMLVTFIVAFFLAGHRAYPFLAQTDPAAGARLLVVEGWMSDHEFDQAVTRFRGGGYDHVVTTGGPVEAQLFCHGVSSYAELAARYLRSRGLKDSEVTPVPAPASAQDRTFLSAVKVRDWARVKAIHLDALDLFSAGTHARRSRALYEMAFGPAVRVGVIAAQPKDYGESDWWRSSAGAKAVAGEVISLAWTACCFHPAQPGSHEEMWGIPRRDSRD